MLKRILLAACMCVLVFSAQAQNIGDEARSFLERERDEVVANMAIGDEKERYETLAAQADRIFDVEAIYRFVVARHARNISADQSKLIIDFFKKNIIVTYAISSHMNAAGLSLKVQRVDIEDLPDNVKRVTALGTVVDTKDTVLAGCNFIMSYENGQFRIFDVKIEGISMLITFRSMFAKMMQNNNNDTALLIRSIEEKSRELDAILENKPVAPTPEYEIPVE